MGCPTHPQSIPWESSTGVRCGICGEPWPRTESTHAALLGQRIFEARCSTSTMTLDDAINAARVTLEDYSELGEHYQREVDEMRATEIAAAESRGAEQRGAELQIECERHTLEALAIGEVHGAAAERERWRGAVKTMVDAMPKCFRCGAVAMRTRGSPGAAPWCDEHDTMIGPLAPLRPLPYAPALRALLAMCESDGAK